MAKYKVIVNSIESFQELVQNVYDETAAIINQAQDQIDKLDSATDLTQELMDGKQRYSKAIHDLICDKDKAIGRRVEIAKLLVDLIKNQGNVQKTLETAEQSTISSLSLDDFKAQLQKQMESAKTTGNGLY